jgi:parallel beta-helix repeat protein
MRVESTMAWRAIGASALALAVSALASSAAIARNLHVSPKGHNTGRCTSKRPCKTISFAVAKAGRGDTVAVAKGTYRDAVSITRPVKLIGTGKPVIDAGGHPNGILIAGRGSRGTLVDGFVVQHALNEGILALRTSRVVIEHNLVRLNDQGVKAAKPTGECAAVGQVPGDCGEGVHLMTVSNATVTGNRVTDNLGGILLTDEFGPTANNVISDNTVLRNVADCGITIAGHNPHAVSTLGVPKPSTAGIYDNRILSNTSNGNGVKGEGAGILLAGAGPGTAVYSNLVKGNVANGNGLGGLTLHSHAPGDYLNGNRIIDNSFSHDALAGNGPGKPGDSDAGLTRTAGIVVFSAVTKLKATIVSGNRLSNEYYGIWTQNAPSIAKRRNSFARSVTVPVFQK